MHTRDRAIGAASSREGADRLQHRTDQELGARDSRGKKHEVDFGEYRKHADAIAPKYAGKRTLPIVHHEIPKMDPKVGSLMHELGEAHKKRAAHLTQHAQLKGQVKAATSQLASRPSPGRLPGEEMAVQQEIAAAKKAVRVCVCMHPHIQHTHTHACLTDTRTRTHKYNVYIHTYVYIYIPGTHSQLPRGVQAHAAGALPGGDHRSKRGARNCGCTPRRPPPPAVRPFTGARGGCRCAAQWDAREMPVLAFFSRGVGDALFLHFSQRGLGGKLCLP